MHGDGHEAVRLCDRLPAHDLLALAQQAPGETEIGECDPRLLPLEEALRQVAGELAEQIVTDGEGATRVLEIRVHGARWVGDARAVAQAIAGSPLVKTALHGGDANWGRIIAAAGNAAVPFDVEELELRVGEHVVFAAGMPIVAAQDAAERAFQRPRVRIALRIGDGEEEVRFLTTDLSADYVSINAHYRT